ncbi:hypothetical protein C8F01DRAFT_1117338 [Mycena amicta]|nr:hypothetical protein C8F01DRAFT_1117338 [Mycena amicta]
MLDHLPPEIIVSLCSWLAAASVTRLSHVSRRCNRIIQQSSAVQYALNLELAGLCNLQNSSFEQTSASRLDALRAYRESWKNLNPKAHPNPTRVRLTGRYWELLGNVFATYNSDHGFSFQRVPCSLRKIPFEHWELPVFPGHLVDFSMDLSQDLLVVVEVASMKLAIHLLSMKTGQPHPAARLPRLAREIQDHVPPTFDFFQIRISGSYVGLMTELEAGHEVASLELFVWEWRTGVLKKYLNSPALTSFAFLDNARIIISVFAHVDPWLDHLAPQLRILDIDGPIHDMHGCFTFCLPLLDTADAEMLILTEPAPAWSTETTRESAFTASHADRLFVVSLHGLDEDDQEFGPLQDPTFLLCFRLSAILDAMGQRREPDQEPNLAWSEWGPHSTRMLRIPITPDPWVCFVYGSRCIIQTGPEVCQILDFKQLYPLSDNRIVHAKKVDKRRRLFKASVTTSAPFSLHKFPIPVSAAVMLTEDSIVTISADEETCTIFSV